MSLPPIQSRQDFFVTFAAHAWEQSIVLLVDELNELFLAKPTIRDDFLRALREVRTNNARFAICSVIAAGTFSILDSKYPLLAHSLRSHYIFN
jgi:hypothetical protein